VSVRSWLMEGCVVKGSALVVCEVVSAHNATSRACSSR
jgi:hypothetical protein